METQTELMPFSPPEKLERELINRSKNLNFYLRKIKVPIRYIDCSFDNFFGQPKLVSRLKKHAQLKPLPGLFLSGKCGCGKTHLATAILRELIINGRDIEKSIRFISTPEIYLAIRESYDKTGVSEREVINEYADLDLLLLDDLGAEKVSEWSIATLSLIIDRRYRELKPTIITSNLTLDDIENNIDARIASRLNDGIIIEIDLPDYRKINRNK